MNKALLKDELENKASVFRRENGYADTEPIQLESLLLKQNVLTIFKPLDKISGMAIRSGEDRFMLVNQNQTLGRQHFTIAHELYHLFIQENFKAQRCVVGLFSKQDDIEEKNADFFAASLLLPKLGIFDFLSKTERTIKNTITTETLFRIHQYYRVSIKALVFRLCDLGYVGTQYFDLVDNLYKTETARLLGYDTKLYKIGNNEKVISNYGILANKLFKNNKISEGKYFQLLNTINIDPLTTESLEND